MGSSYRPRGLDGGFAWDGSIKGSKKRGRGDNVWGDSDGSDSDEFGHALFGSSSSSAHQGAYHDGMRMLDGDDGDEHHTGRGCDGTRGGDDRSEQGSGCNKIRDDRSEQGSGCNKIRDDRSGRARRDGCNEQDNGRRLAPRDGGSSSSSTARGDPNNTMQAIVFPSEKVKGKVQNRNATHPTNSFHSTHRTEQSLAKIVKLMERHGLIRETGETCEKTGKMMYEFLQRDPQGVNGDDELHRRDVCSFMRRMFSDEALGFTVPATSPLACINGPQCLLSISGVPGIGCFQCADTCNPKNQKQIGGVACSIGDKVGHEVGFICLACAVASAYKFGVARKSYVPELQCVKCSAANTQRDGARRIRDDEKLYTVYSFFLSLLYNAGKPYSADEEFNILQAGRRAELSERFMDPIISMCKRGDLAQLMYVMYMLTDRDEHAKLVHPTFYDGVTGKSAEFQPMRYALMGAAKAWQTMLHNAADHPEGTPGHIPMGESVLAKWSTLDAQVAYREVFEVFVRTNPIAAGIGQFSMLCRLLNPGEEWKKYSTVLAPPARLDLPDPTNYVKESLGAAKDVMLQRGDGPGRGTVIETVLRMTNKTNHWYNRCIAATAGGPLLMPVRHIITRKAYGEKCNTLLKNDERGKKDPTAKVAKTAKRLKFLAEELRKDEYVPEHLIDEVSGQAQIVAGNVKEARELQHRVKKQASASHDEWAHDARVLRHAYGEVNDTLKHVPKSTWGEKDGPRSTFNSITAQLDDTFELLRHTADVAENLKKHAHARLSSGRHDGSV